MKPSDALKGLGARLEGETIQGHYYIEKLMQRGGMAWLYRARHRILQEPMAIKILFPQWSDDPLVRVRFIDEAKIQFKLKHPYIVQVTDVIEDNGLLGIVQEWVEGEDLNRYIQRRQEPLAMDEIWELTKPLLEALDFAHEMGVVHRDIKPSNVLLGRVGGRVVPKLADFGIAKLLDELGERTSTGTTLGTMKYIAPEQIRDSKSVDHRADIYGFGVMLYRMATGEYPFTGQIESVMFKQLYEPPPRPRELVPSITPEFEEVILQCLTKHPEDRFPDCAEVLETLTQIMPKIKRRGSRGPLLGDSALVDLPSEESTPGVGQSISALSRDPVQARETFDPSDISGHPRQEPSPPNLAEASSPRMSPSFSDLRSYHQNPHATQDSSYPGQQPSAPSFISHPHQARPTPVPPTQGPPTGAGGYRSVTNEGISAVYPSRAPSPYSPAPSAFGGESPWGEFMLETEDDYYDIDDDPTEIPQESPFQNFGEGSSPEHSAAGSSEGFEPPTMLEAAPSLAELAKIGRELQNKDGAQAEHPHEASEGQAEPKAHPGSSTPSVSTPAPPPEEELTGELQDVIESSETVGDDDELFAFGIEELIPPPPSGAAAPLQLERSGVFKLKLGEDDLATTGTGADMFDPDGQVPPPPIELMEQAVSSQSLIQQPLTSEAFDNYLESRKRLPFFAYPLIGIGLGAIVLGISWAVLMFTKKEPPPARQPAQRAPATSMPHAKARKPAKPAKPRKAPKKLAKATPRPWLKFGCKKKLPASARRLSIQIRPRLSFVMEHPDLKSKLLKKRACLTVLHKSKLTLKRRGFATCSFKISLKDRKLRLRMQIKKRGKTYKNDYCISP